jgi:hypothetical protein
MEYDVIIPSRVIAALCIVLALCAAPTSEAEAPDHDTYAHLGNGACMMMPSGVRFCAFYGVQ